MPDMIKIQKTTLVLLGGIILAIGAGAMILSAEGYAGAQADLASAMGPRAGAIGGIGAAPEGQGGGNDSFGAVSPQIQDIYVRALAGGEYDVQEITVKKGVPVRLHFTAESGAGCGRWFYIYGLGIQALSRNGEEDVVEFTPTDAGAYEYNCGMRMFRPGMLVVK
ncbi:cupredoxin domain-containing protein [Candidatus Micrarchaeota archaeon]|nr:cupredoxin domain-containing protein [Candidatus Micrarchaeota archaeon]